MEMMIQEVAPRGGGRPPAELSTAGVKMLVSNLGPEVTDEDLQELFEEHGGPIKKAEIFYKQDGSSSGQGEVVFKRRADADKVYVLIFVCVCVCLCVRLYAGACGASALFCTFFLGGGDIHLICKGIVELMQGGRQGERQAGSKKSKHAGILKSKTASERDAQVLESPAMRYNAVVPMLILTHESSNLCNQPLFSCWAGSPNSLHYVCSSSSYGISTLCVWRTETAPAGVAALAGDDRGHVVICTLISLSTICAACLHPTIHIHTTHTAHTHRAHTKIQVLNTLQNVPLDARPLQLALVGVTATPAPQPKQQSTKWVFPFSISLFPPFLYLDHLWITGWMR